MQYKLDICRRSFQGNTAQEFEVEKRFAQRVMWQDTRRHGEVLHIDTLRTFVQFKIGRQTRAFQTQQRSPQPIRSGPPFNGNESMMIGPHGSRAMDCAREVEFGSCYISRTQRVPVHQNFWHYLAWFGKRFIHNYITVSHSYSRWNIFLNQLHLIIMLLLLSQPCCSK